MTSIDFSDLNSEQFEELCEDLFKAMGFNDPLPERSGRGPDLGRDLIVTEHRASGILGSSRRFRWLVECKNFAISDKSVQPQDIGSITDKLVLHNADGYLLITSTVPSTTVENIIRAIDNNESLSFEATYWAKPRLIDEILKHRSVYEKYFQSLTPEPTRITHWSKRNPFLELFPYEEAHTEYFFGREKEITEVVERVYQHNLILLYGESGVGKTSLIQAGISPILRDEGVIVVNKTVGTNFNSRDLLSVVQSALPESSQFDSTIDEEEIDSCYENLVTVAEELRKLDQRLVVFLDQFETIFQGSNQNLEELGHIFSLISSVIKKYRSITFVFSLRSDYLDNLGVWTNEYRIPELWQNSYPIRKFSMSQVTEVLNKAPVSVSAEFSEDLVQIIANDLQNLDRGRIYPPNLQIVANKVFDEARSATPTQTDRLIIRLENYEAVGGTEGILESFLDDKLAEFGSNREIAHKVLLSFVRATGRRIAVSESELSKIFSMPLETLRPIIVGLIKSRLVKPTDTPDVYELVHDVVAQKVLEATDEEQKKAKAVIEAFQVAVNTWESEQLLESGRKLDLFYQYRHNLDIGSNELLFLLLSEARGSSASSDLFGFTFLPEKMGRKRRLRWINTVRPSVNIELLEILMAAYDHENSDNKLIAELIVDLCHAHDFEVQRALVTRLDVIKGTSLELPYTEAYLSSAIPTSASLSYLQEIAMADDLPPASKKPIIYRILGHYQNRTRNTEFGSSIISSQQLSQDTDESFPVDLLNDEVFRETTFDYLKNQASSSKYKVKLLKLLYEIDPDKAVETLWNLVELTRHINYVDTEILQLLRIYDPRRTIEKVVHAVGQEKRFYRELSVTLLEAMEAPEADDLLIKDLERYVQQLEGGSKSWRGGILKYWRKSIRKTIQAVSRRRLRSAVPHLETIVLRYEPENIKLDCIDALLSISDEINCEVLVKLLEDHFPSVRNRASKQLIQMSEQREVIVTELIKSITEQEEPKYRHQAKRNDAMKRKINTLYKMCSSHEFDDPQTTKILEHVANNDNDSDVKSTASRALNALKKS
jgi:HEAT repeat protein